MIEVLKPKHVNRRRTFLRDWRKFRDLSQERAADRLAIDRTTLSKIERGQLPYNQDLLEQLAEAYSCEVGDLLTVNPLFPDKPKLIYNRLRSAPEAVQQRAMAVLEALLQAS